MNSVVIMCGGRGQRLHPLTARRPKPMLPVGSKPILETILREFVSQGFKRFYFCTGYRAKVINDYFGDGLKFGFDLRQVHLGIDEDDEMVTTCVVIESEVEAERRPKGDTVEVVWDAIKTLEPNTKSTKNNSGFGHGRVTTTAFPLDKETILE